MVGGSITAARSLEEFVAGKPLVNIDIAGSAFFEEARPWTDAADTGAFVRTQVQIALNWQSTSD